MPVRTALIPLFAAIVASIAPHIRGYRKNGHYFPTPWQYLDIDTTAPGARR
jgi:hypothetical protein